MIITAYNEERDLRAKLENTLALDYPAEKLEIIVASDCSSDRTDDIAREFADRGVRLHRQPKRLGKTAAQNAAVKLASGEIILFSDATSLVSAGRGESDHAEFCRPGGGLRCRAASLCRSRADQLPDAARVHIGTMKRF